MNTLTQNTASDTPAFLQFNQFESTGIRELTPEEIELVNGACNLYDGLVAAGFGAATGAIVTKNPYGVAAFAIFYAGAYYYSNCYGV